MSGRKAVITGLGLLTSLGKTVEENWTNLQAGRSGIGHHPNDGLPEGLQYAAKVGSFEVPAVSRSLSAQMKFLNRGSLLGFAAACQAVEQSGAALGDIPEGRRALYVGSSDFTKCGHEFLYSALRESADGTGRGVDFPKLNAAALLGVNPFFLLESIGNNLFSFLSAAIEFRGPNTSLASLSPCGAQALELANKSIQQGRAEVALAVGSCSWVNEIPLFELEGMGLLSKCRLGSRSFRPFDKARDGFIPGEGGAAILLEAEDIARRRGGTVLGRINGTGNCIDPFPESGAQSKVAARSMHEALETAARRVGDLAFICAHASATRKGDRAELESLAEVTAAVGASVPVCGLKPYTGHMGAASDLAEIILSLKGVARGVVPGTLNFKETDRGYSALKISCEHQPCADANFLSLSSGIGGQSSAVVVSTH